MLKGILIKQKVQFLIYMNNIRVCKGKMCQSMKTTKVTGIALHHTEYRSCYCNVHMLQFE